MYSRGIRGAITVENDTPQEIEQSVIELFSKIKELNTIAAEDISHIIFSTTKDLKSAYPAKFLRHHFEVDIVPLMCMNEADI